MAMPNQPKTKARSVRVPEDLWQAAKARAKEEGESVTDVLVRALKRYRSYPNPAPAMKPELWDAICSRDDDDFESAFGWEEAEWAVDDRHALLFEVERLRAELAQVTDQAEARGIEAHAAGDLIVSLTEDLDEAREQIAAVRECHYSDGAESPFCEDCGYSWPCPTIRALDGSDA
jgi:hypothetical protein